MALGVMKKPARPTTAPPIRQLAPLEISTASGGKAKGKRVHLPVFAENNAY